MRHGDIKTAEMSNEKVVVKVIMKVSNHRKAFAFHDNKGADHSMVGKPFSSGFGVFPNSGEVKIQEKRVIKFCNRL